MSHQNTINQDKLQIKKCILEHYRKTQPNEKFLHSSFKSKSIFTLSAIFIFVIGVFTLSIGTSTFASIRTKVISTVIGPVIVEFSDNGITANMSGVADDGTEFVGGVAIIGPSGLNEEFIKDASKIIQETAVHLKSTHLSGNLSIFTGDGQGIDGSGGVVFDSYNASIHDINSIQK